jgi:hypothetical protein
VVLFFAEASAFFVDDVDFEADLESEFFLPNALAQLLAYFLVAPMRVMVTGLLLVRS